MPTKHPKYIKVNGHVYRLAILGDPSATAEAIGIITNMHSALNELPKAKDKKSVIVSLRNDVDQLSHLYG